MLYLKYFVGKSFVETPMPLLCVLFFLVGVICVQLGLIAEILMRTYFESQGKTPTRSSAASNSRRMNPIHRNCVTATDHSTANDARLTHGFR